MFAELRTVQDINYYTQNYSITIAHLKNSSAELNFIPNTNTVHHIYR